LITVIINPFSGVRGRGRTRAALAARLLEAEGVSADVQVSEYAGHAVELARQAAARGARLVCAWGGDGTVNEVARVLAHTDIPLGVIPEGSGNGFARELDLFHRPARALHVALRGRDRVIDAGEIGGRCFFNLAGVGLDAHIARAFNTRSPDRRGFWRYIALGWQQLARYQPAHYRIDADGERLDGRALMVVLANLRQYGNNARIAPHAVADDGRLDLVVVGPRSPVAAVALTPRLFTGTVDRVRGVRTRTIGRVTISSDGPLLCHVDGETFVTGTELVGEVKPNALRVRVPL